MRKPYCCEASRHLFDQYYSRQQRGGGDFPVYVGRVKQRGHGLGDMFSRILRSIVPFFKSIAPHALRAGANIVEDVSRGKTWKDSAFEHVPTLAEQVPEAFSRAVSRYKDQSGSGIRRRRSTRRKQAKRAKRDIFS
jgi:hypothetical protein